MTTQPGQKNTKTEKVKVFLSDPQVLFREGIHFILSGEDDFEVTGETTNNDEATSLIEVNPPNIAILSLDDPKTDGCQATRRIRRNLPSVNVILIMDKKDDARLFEVIKCGASAFFTKDADPDSLLDVIRVVAQGNQPIIDELLTPAIAAKMIAEFEDVATINRQMDNLLAGLAAKEAQIFSGIAAGNSLQQVAAKLDVNEENVRRNLRLALGKLVNNEQAKVIFEAAQRSLPSLIRGPAKVEGRPGEYVTRSEFNEFKEALFSRLKSIISEKPLA
ncbi:MAG: hypothetical protein A2137_06175 [Chloroflexi bacterium RBG_16_58_8]|nr:MAG: hypothetical protein A2137_06175 [Chloroflexi bacterium RBG_16_58_8]